LVVNGNVNLGATGALNLAVVAGSLNTAGSVSFAAPALTNITSSSPITGTGAVASNTNSTPDQANLGTTTFAVDSPAYTGAITVNTGNLRIQTAGALGTTAGNTTISGGANAVNGTLMIAPISGNLSIAEPISVAGRQTGAIDVPHIENVSGNNTLTGAITPTAGGSDYNFQSDAGGSLTISSGFSTAAFTSLRNLKLQGSGDGTWNGQLVDVAAAPLNVVKTGSGTWKLGNAAGNSYRGNTTISGGTLLMGANNVVGGAVGASSNLILGGGKLATGGFSNTFNHLATANAVNSVIDLGAGNSSLVFANSNPTIDGTLAVWSGTLQISNWTYGSDQIKVGTDATGLDATSQLGQITFDHFLQGASISSTGIVTPVIGDIDQNGTRDSADLNELMVALTNPAVYNSFIANLNATQNRGLLPSDVNFILDVNLDGASNNLDLQAEISAINTGHTAPSLGSASSSHSVPEPSAIILLALGFVLLGFKSKRLHSALSAIQLS
jgi:autotransporter-associated beta strand protein